MRIAVRYHTRSGNTEKLARAIAEAVGVSAEKVSADLPEQADVLFLGCSYYAFDVDEAVKDFIRRNSGKIGCIVCFGTSAMMRSVRKPVQRVTEPAGVRLHPEEFHCRAPSDRCTRGARMPGICGMQRRSRRMSSIRSEMGGYNDERGL